MKHFSTTTLLLCAIFSGIFSVGRAQDSQQEGYIIKSDGSKEVGWIIKTNGDSRYTSASFSSSSSSKKTTFTYEDLLEYGIGEDVKFLSVNAFEGQELINDLDSSFLQVLVSGRLSLLQGIGPRFILMDSTRQLYPLKNVELEQLGVAGLTTASYQEERRKNTGIMVKLVEDCLPVAMKISNGDYQFEQNARMLADIVIDYNECQGHQSIDYLSRRKKVALALQGSAGVSFNKPWFKDIQTFVPVEDGPYLSDYPYKYSPSLVLSIGGELWFPFIYDQISLQFRASTATYGFGGSYYGPVYAGSADSVSSFLDLEYRTLDLSLGIRYRFLPTSKIDPYVLFGGMIRHHYVTRSAFHSVRFNTDRPTITNRTVATVNKNGLYWGLGASLPLNKALPFRISIEYKGLLSGLAFNQGFVPLLTQNFREHGLHLVLSTKPF